MTKDQAAVGLRNYSRAMAEIAREHGKDSWLYKAMGTAAWGRHDHEGPSKDAMLLALGWYEGLRYGLLHVARDLNLRGERDLAGIHDRFERGTQ